MINNRYVVTSPVVTSPTQRYTIVLNSDFIYTSIIGMIITDVMYTVLPENNALHCQVSYIPARLSHMMETSALFI